MDFNIIQGQGSLTNTGDAYSGTLSVGVTSYRDKGVYLCKISSTNTTTTPSLNINSIGAKTIVNNDGSAISIGALLISGWYEFMYDSSSDKMLCLNASPISTIVEKFALTRTAAQGSGTVTINTTRQLKLAFVTTGLDYVGDYMGSIGRYDGTTNSCLIGDFIGGSFITVSKKDKVGKSNNPTNDGFSLLINNVTATSFDIVYTKLGSGLNIWIEIDVIE